MGSVLIGVVAEGYMTLCYVEKCTCSWFSYIPGLGCSKDNCDCKKCHSDWDHWMGPDSTGYGGRDRVAYEVARIATNPHAWYYDPHRMGFLESEHCGRSSQDWLLRPGMRIEGCCSDPWEDFGNGNCRNSGSFGSVRHAYKPHSYHGDNFPKLRAGSVVTVTLSGGSVTFTHNGKTVYNVKLPENCGRISLAVSLFGDSHVTLLSPRLAIKSLLALKTV